MKKKNTNFFQDNHALSEALGFLLILAIVSSLSIIYLSNQIPLWNERAELAHMDVVYDDMIHLKTDIFNAAKYITPIMSTIHLGTGYPSQKYFVSPNRGRVSGTLAVRTNLPITIEYTDFYNETYVTTYNSSTITYTMYGRSDTPQLVYEHGVIIKDFGTANITIDKQPLVVQDEIYIPLVMGTAGSTFSSDIESLEIYPCTQTQMTENVESINITLETNYPELWKKLLKNLNTTNTTAYVSADDKITINSTATNFIIFPITTGSFPGLYAGVAEMVTEVYEDTLVSAGIPMGPGEFILTKKKNKQWVKIPTSANITEFIITDIAFQNPHDAKIKLEVKDNNDTKWTCELQFDDKPKQEGRIYLKKIKAEIKDGPKYEKDNLDLTWDATAGIDLLNLPTQYPELPDPDQYNASSYRNANVEGVNILEIKDLKKIHFVKIRLA